MEIKFVEKFPDDISNLKEDLDTVYIKPLLSTLKGGFSVGPIMRESGVEKMYGKYKKSELYGGFENFDDLSRVEIDGVYVAVNGLEIILGMLLGSVEKGKKYKERLMTSNEISEELKEKIKAVERMWKK